MITGIVKAVDIAKSCRLDAEFHLRGRRIKMSCVKRQYCIDIEADEMAAILDLDKERNEDTLADRILAFDGVTEVEYDGMLGPHIWFDIEVEYDKRDVRERVGRVVREYITKAIAHKSKLGDREDT